MTTTIWEQMEYISLFRVTDVCDEVCVPIKCDEQLLEWFNLNLENGVAYIDAQINDFEWSTSIFTH
jgi:hypothetical protein